MHTLQHLSTNHVTTNIPMQYQTLRGQRLSTSTARKPCSMFHHQLQRQQGIGHKLHVSSMTQQQKTKQNNNLQHTQAEAPFITAEPATDIYIGIE